jgi:hypothetical protein
MITIDKLLSDLLTQHSDYVSLSVGKKDFETMKGLLTAISSPSYSKVITRKSQKTTTTV